MAAGIVIIIRACAGARDAPQPVTRAGGKSNGRKSPRRDLPQDVQVLARARSGWIYEVWITSASGSSSAGVIRRRLRCRRQPLRLTWAALAFGSGLAALRNRGTTNGFPP